MAILIVVALVYTVVLVLSQKFLWDWTSDPAAGWLFAIFTPFAIVAITMLAADVGKNTRKWVQKKQTLRR